MKKIMTLFILLLIPTISFTETHIPGGDVSGLWTFDNSPYIIDGQILLQSGDELVIEPGVQVLFSGHYKFDIYGRLLAEGTAVDTIVFAAQDTTIGWNGLRFLHTNSNGQDSSKVIYFKLEYGNSTVYPQPAGGAIFCYHSSDILIKNCLITKNKAVWGGGICCWSNSSPKLENVIISENTDYAEGGGGIYISNSSISLTNVTIAKNISAYTGGGIHCNWGSISLESTTISENIASYKGGGIYFCGGSLSFSELNRCNLFFNFAGSGNELYSSYPTVTNIIVDTFTVLQPDDYFAYPIDNFSFDILNNKVEQVNQDLYVNPTGSNYNSGLSVEEPLLTISYALAKIIPDSINPHIIYLANGTYSPSQTGETFPLNCRSYVSLLGEDEYSTILNVEGLTRILHFENDNYSNVENMTIQNGFALGGGGIYCNNSNPRLENVTISGNNAIEGGGVNCYNNSNPILYNVSISENTAMYGGGGIYCFDSNPSLTNVTINKNTSYGGGGIYCWHSCPSIVNVTISGNTTEYGGGIYCEDSSPNLVNVTISENTANDDGGGICCYYNSNPTLLNCILWNDTPNEISGSATATYSDVQDGWTGIGNISADPLFADPENGDFHLTWANFPIPDSTKSPCIDTGTPDTTGLNLPPWDLDGNPRIVNSRIDMGAYEWQGIVGVDELNEPSIATGLFKNYPNPFSSSTIISFNLATNLQELARIKIYNIKGQLVKTLLPHTNYYSTTHQSPLTKVIWDGKDENGKPVSSGIYFYSLKIGDKVIDVKKCLLLK